MRKKECWALVLAAGQGSRLAEATGGTAKQFLRWRGAPLWWASAQALAASPRISGLVFVFPPDMTVAATEELRELDQRHSLGVPWKTTEGGERRQDSVRLGLKALPDECGFVLIHDSARPFVTPALTTRVADVLMGELSGKDERTKGDDELPAVGGVIPGLPVTDTIKEIYGEGDKERVTRTPARSALRAVQTPQGFPLAPLREAHERAQAENREATDDASLMERCGYTVLVMEGDADNIKITTPKDLRMLQDQRPPRLCAGYGYDVHRYGGDRPLILGGVLIPGDFTVLAHSDGDVLLHALMDAILGCLGAGDIGRLFPDNDPGLEGISSALLLDHVLDMAAQAGVILTHIDLTVIAQKPKLAPHADAIRRNVARLLGLSENKVNFKATTEEGLGFTGELLGLKAVALVSALENFQN